ncbi:hypothetical protein [Tetrasphaera phage TJE1]|uniref:Uncharacterized protein n=1 Tax=Tetrasphaera phage TJE1 TaxID=981335 RepID=G4W964_9CAUD|nr:hypothetical protein G185_gp32 [Tetrasphaera phage TJE1]ADX42552.1 hypothetical protein [Tetrasphaera phage TJE1]
MPNDYDGSLAQQYVSFSALFSIQSNPGANFGKAMVYVDSATISGLWVDGSTVPQPTEDVEITSQNYQDYVSGGLLDWLTGYFGSNAVANIYVAVWDSSLPSYSGLINAYAATKYDAYFKTMYTAGLGVESAQNDAMVALAEIAFPDTGVFSQVGFGTTEPDNLLNESVTSLLTAINGSSGDAIVAYGDASQSTNPWLDQLGLTLGALNGSGTAIGNALDYIATLNRGASGTDGANLTALQVAALKAQGCGYWATLGNSTGQVALYNPTTVKGAYPGSKWVVAYIDFVASIRSIEFLTDPATPQGKRRNNENYQAILGILNAAAAPFTDKGGIGVLQNFTTAGAPRFSQLSGGGSTLIVPNAWAATWLQGIHSIVVQGTLYIQA